MQKFSFKKGMAFALAATTALSGLPASPTVAYAATTTTTTTTDTGSSSVLTTVTLTADDIRVLSDSKLTYDGTIKTPSLYYDANGDKRFNKDDGDVLLAASTNMIDNNPNYAEDKKVIREALVATSKDSNVNASTKASVTIPANSYKIDSNLIYKFDSDIDITYTIEQADLDSATIYINGVEYNSESGLPRVEYSSKGVNFKLSDTAYDESTAGTDNIVNIYLKDSDGNYTKLVKNTAGITLENDGKDQAVAGSTYTLTIGAGSDATNFISGKEVKFQYTAIRNGLADAAVTLRSGYDKLTYNGSNQALTLSNIRTIVLDGAELTKNDFTAIVTPSSFSYADIYAYDMATDKDAYAKSKGFDDKTKYEASINYDSAAIAHVKVYKDSDGKGIRTNAIGAGSYKLFLIPDTTKYSGYITYPFSIDKLDVSSLTGVNSKEKLKKLGVRIDIDSKTYTGDSIEPIATAYVYNGTTEETFTITKDSKPFSVDYANNTDAPQAVNAYVSALSEVGLSERSDDGTGTVTIHGIKAEASSDAVSVTGQSDEISYSNITDNAVKTTYKDSATWRAAAIAAKTNAENDYLPQATLSFNTANVTGTVTIKKAFEIEQFDLEKATPNGAEEAFDGKRNFSYSLGEMDPIYLDADGIQLILGTGTDKIIAPSDTLKAKYKFVSESASGDADMKNFTDLDKSLSGGVVYGVVEPADGNNNVKGKKGFYFGTGKSLKGMQIKLSGTTLVYNGENVFRNAGITVIDPASGNAEIASRYYQLEYRLNGTTDYVSEARDAGTYTVRARGRGDYAGSITNTITVNPKQINNQNKGNAYDVSVGDAKKVIGEPISRTTKTVNVAYKTNLTAVTGFVNDSGESTVMDTVAANTTLNFDKDYTLKYYDDATGANGDGLDVKDIVTKKGTYSIYLVGKNNYTGKLDSGYDIVVSGKTLTSSDVNITSTVGGSFTFAQATAKSPVKIYYTGSDITVDQLGITAYDGTTKLTEGTDYIATITVNASEVSNTKLGIVTISCPATSNYSAPNITAYFEVVPGNLANEKIYAVNFVKGNDTNYEEGDKPEFVITDTRNNKQVSYEYSNAKLNFIPSYPTQTTVGKDAGSLVISARRGDSSLSGNYVVEDLKTSSTIQRTVTFNTVASIKNQRIGGISPVAVYTYDGNDQLPKIVVKKKDGDELKVGTDYTVTIKNAEETASYNAMINVLATTDLNAVDADPTKEISEGVYSQPYHIVIDGAGDYVGTKTYKLYMLPRSIRDKSVSISAEDQTYNGSDLTPVVVKYNDQTLEEGKDYTITYQNNKNVGTASYVVKGIGNFSGRYSIYDSDPAQFEIKPAESTRVYTEDELKDEVQKAVEAALKEQTASGNAEAIQKIVDEAVAQAKEEATKGMITEEAAEAAKNAAVAEATKDTISKSDSDAAIAAAVAEATKDTISKTDSDAAVAAAVAAATKDTISKTEADKATKTAVAAAQAAATKAATTVKKGDTFIVGKNIYQITNVSKKTAEFVGTYSKAKTITIPATAKNSKNSVSYKITTVAASAMKGNTTATKVTIGKNVTKINGSAFQSCTKLATVTIGKSVKTIGKSAFNGCTKLKKVTIKSTKLKTVKSKAFKIAKKAKVTVPSGKASSYKKLLKSAGLPSTATVK